MVQPITRKIPTIKADSKLSINQMFQVIRCPVNKSLLYVLLSNHFMVNELELSVILKITECQIKLILLDGIENLEFSVKAF